MNSDVEKVRETRKRIFKFILVALPIMGPDCLKLAAEISAMVAGGADPALIADALNNLEKINADFDQVEAAMGTAP